MKPSGSATYIPDDDGDAASGSYFSTSARGYVDWDKERSIVKTSDPIPPVKGRHPDRPPRTEPTRYGADGRRKRK